MVAPNLTVLLCPTPAREQLRRSRHSRTFLVESGVGELWAEMQEGETAGHEETPQIMQTSCRKWGRAPPWSLHLPSVTYAPSACSYART